MMPQEHCVVEKPLPRLVVPESDPRRVPALPEPMTARERALGEVLGEPTFACRDDDQNHRIDVHAFGRNFVEDGDVPTTTATSSSRPA
jgi:hypothetical protein